jgi:hypothetical protein
MLAFAMLWPGGFDCVARDSVTLKKIEVNASPVTSNAARPMTFVFTLDLLGCMLFELSIFARSAVAAKEEERSGHIYQVIFIRSSFGDHP